MITVLGTTTADLIITGVGGLPTFDGDEFTASSLVYCDNPLNVTLGGNGANTAYVLGGLGLNVALGSAIGRDELGNLLLGWLNQNPTIDLTGLLRLDTHASPSTTTVMDARRNRMSFYHPGAAHHVGVVDLPERILSGADLVLLSGPSLLPGVDLPTLFNTAHSATTLIDIGPAIGTPPTFTSLRPVLPKVNGLIGNAHEIITYAEEQPIEEAIAATLAAGVGYVIVKQGAAGATLHTAAGAQRVPCTPITTGSTIGAGDAFNAGLLYALSKGHSPLEAVRYANLTAMLMLESGRGVLGGPTAAALEAQYTQEQPHA